MVSFRTGLLDRLCMPLSSDLSKKKKDFVVIMAATEGIKKTCKLKKEKSQNKVTINAPYAYVEVIVYF